MSTPAPDAAVGDLEENVHPDEPPIPENEPGYVPKELATDGDD